MNTCFVFQLNIWRNGSNCNLQLDWSESQENLSASLEYPSEFTRLHRDWKKSYLKAYPSPSRGRVENDGSIPPLKSNQNSQAETAKQELLSKFHQWLGGEALLDIRHRIQQEANHRVLHRRRIRGSDRCVDLLIACNDTELERLPWEAWRLGPNDKRLENLRISRTIFNVGDEPVFVEKKPRPGGSRILAILANASDLECLETDRKVVRSLAKIAGKVELVEFTSEQTGAEFREKIKEKLRDDRGWDVLIFAGHSNETEWTRGRIELAPHVSLEISEIEEDLKIAKNFGLRLAIFNSCNGLSIANSLIKCGLSQVVVMREPIHDEAASVFLEHFCQSFAARNDVHDAVLSACKYFESERYIYPSAHLIPSLFRHPSPDANLFRLEPYGWRRFWRTWRPTRGEAIALGTTLIVGSMVPVQDLLFDLRTFTQAVYRDTTEQFPQNAQPPVLLIAIDQESVNQAIADFEDFQVWPMDRRYLADLVNKLSDFQVKTIGIDYEIYTQERGEEELIDSIQTAIEQQQSWLVFAVNKRKNRKVFPKVASPTWSFEGDINFFRWEVEFPTDETCAETCPFAYLLALSNLLNLIDSTLIDLPQPSLQSKRNFQQEVSSFIYQESDPNQVVTSLKRAESPFGWSSIIDFSIPTKQVYDRIPAWQFRKLGLPNPEVQQKFERQVAIIASDEYQEATDKFSVPLAIEYWCHWSSEREFNKEKCPQHFTGGETHAYMVYHLLSQHRVTLIPNHWMILIAALLGKSTTLILLKQPKKARERKRWILIYTTGIFGITGLQLYISASVLIPYCVPAFIFWFFVKTAFRSKHYA